MLRSLIGFLVFISVNSSQARDLNPIFNLLKPTGENYQVVGVVCEQVAKLEMEREYGPKYFVTTGIEYGNPSHVIGELDVVVFDKSTGKAVMVGEVKCWENASGGLRKAYDQRQRFINTIKNRQQVQMYSKSARFDVKQFDGQIRYMAISYLGTKSVGYDEDLDYTLEELMKLRQMMIQCQNQGSCPGARKH